MGLDGPGWALNELRSVGFECKVLETRKFHWSVNEVSLERRECCPVRDYQFRSLWADVTHGGKVIHHQFGRRLGHCQ